MVEVKSQKPTFQSFCNPLFWPPCILGVPPIKLWTPLQEPLNPLESRSVALSQWSGNLGHLTHSSSKPLFHVLRTLLSEARWIHQRASPVGWDLMGYPLRPLSIHRNTSLKFTWTSWSQPRKDLNKDVFLRSLCTSGFFKFYFGIQVWVLQKSWFVGNSWSDGESHLGCPQAKVWEMQTRFDLTELLIFPCVLPYQTIRWR